MDLKKNTFQEVTIVSNLLSSDEISDILNQDNIETRVQSKQDEERVGLTTVVLIAYTIYAIEKGINITELIIRKLKKHSAKKYPNGEISVKCPSASVRVSFDLSEEDFEEKVGLIKQLCVKPKIFIKKGNDS